MRRQHDLDRQPEQRPQVFDHLLARDTVRHPVLRDLETATEVAQCVAGDDRTDTLDPEHKVVVQPSRERLEADRKPVTRSVGLPAALCQQRRDVGAEQAFRDLLRSDAVLSQVVIAVSGGGVNTGAPKRSTRLCASRLCHGAVSTTTGSRSAATPRISSGTANGSKRRSRAPSSSAHDETIWGHH
jgi:hypothetical protein